MKCPKCGFTSFDHLQSCRKCGGDLTEVKGRFMLGSILFPEAGRLSPVAPEKATAAEVPGSGAGRLSTVEMAMEEESPVPFGPEEVGWEPDPADETELFSFESLVAAAGLAATEMEAAETGGSELDVSGTDGGDPDADPGADDAWSLEGLGVDAGETGGDQEADPADEETFPAADLPLLFAADSELLEEPELNGSAVAIGQNLDADEWDTFATSEVPVEPAAVNASFHGRGSASPAGLSGARAGSFPAITAPRETAAEESAEEPIRISLEEFDGLPPMLDSVPPFDAAPPLDAADNDFFLPDLGEATAAGSEPAEAGETAADYPAAAAVGAAGEPEVAAEPVAAGTRVVATLADLLLLLVVFALFLLAGELALRPAAASAARPLAVALLDQSIPYFLVLFCLGFGYFTLFHFLLGQTVGKMLFRLRVETMTGASLSFSHAFLRSTGGLLSCLVAGLGFLPVLRRGGRGWNDRLAGTWVVRSPEK